MMNAVRKEERHKGENSEQRSSQDDDRLQRDSVEGAVHSFPIIRRRSQQTVERNQPFQAYRFFRKTEHVLPDGMIYTAFSMTRRERTKVQVAPLYLGETTMRRWSITIVLAVA